MQPWFGSMQVTVSEAPRHARVASIRRACHVPQPAGQDAVTAGQDSESCAPASEKVLDLDVLEHAGVSEIANRQRALAVRLFMEEA